MSTASVELSSGKRWVWGLLLFLQTATWNQSSLGMTLSFEVRTQIKKTSPTAHTQVIWETDAEGKKLDMGSDESRDWPQTWEDTQKREPLVKAETGVRGPMTGNKGVIQTRLAIRSQEDRVQSDETACLATDSVFCVLIPPNLSSPVGLAGSQLVNRKGKGMRRSQQTWSH